MSKPKIIKCTSVDGTSFEYVDEVIGSGMMKDVYFSPDKSYVVAFFRGQQDAQAKERLESITGRYRETLLSNNGDYWNKLFCWPSAVIDQNGKLGLVASTYPANFFMKYGSQNGDAFKLKGKEKEGKWFASSFHRNKNLDPRELGNWMTHIKMCISISRAVKKMHMMGLAHSDLSYKNVLVDPESGAACLIDIDGLVVPGKYPPDVVGTPDFIAPEVVETAHLNKTDPKRSLPRRETDLHALSVLIYMYLLYRHPLRGRKVHDLDDDVRDESLTMGAKALFVEHPTDKSNRINPKHKRPSDLPWADTDKLPYTITGPYLSELFDKAFIGGLHDPSKRPSAGDWETALIKTFDLMQPCTNSSCSQKWFVFNNTKVPTCPFCSTSFKGKLPILNLYSSRNAGKFLPDNHRLIVWTGQSLFQWHTNALVAPNETLTDDQKKRAGYFVFHQNAWWLVNERLQGLINAADKSPIPVGSKVMLQEGTQLLFGKESGDRLAVVQLVQN
jgi:serine/threonine protein kinase